MNLIPESFDSIKTVINACIEKEMQPDGLLKDVETYIPTYYNDDVVDEPVVWVTQHPSRAERKADLSQTMDILTPFEFDCSVYKPELEDAEIASQNLAFRVVLAITLNILTVQQELLGKRIIKRVDFETYYHVGDVQIVGKSDKLPTTGVVLNFVHTINWKMCCKKINNNKGD